MNRRIVAGIILIMSASCLFGCKNEDSTKEAKSETITESDSEPVAEDQSDCENRFKELLQNNMMAEDGELLDFICDDFDLDGKFEAFGYTGVLEQGDEYMPDLHTGYLWFVNENGAEKLSEEERSFARVFRVLDFCKRKYVALDEYYVTARVTYLYSVKDGTVYEDNTSRIGDMSDTENGEVSILLSAYDGTYDPQLGGCIGHTWKPYYFYYDEAEDGLKEYRGEEITEEKANEICGFDVIGEIKENGYAIGTIYYRANGILNINYSFENDLQEISYYNANYDSVHKQFIDVWGEGQNTWQTSNFGGIYESGL